MSFFGYSRRSNGWEGGVTPSIIDEFHSWDIQGAESEFESGVT